MIAPDERPLAANEGRSGLMTRAEAERATERIRVALDRVSLAWEKLGERIAEAYERRADLALGYNSWAEYAEAELRPAEGLAADVRRQLVGLLSAQGMSTRAIAPTVGVSHMQVSNDRRGSGVKGVYTSPRSGSTVATNTGVVIAEQRHIDPVTGEVLGSVAALAEVVANSHPISRDAVDNLGENLNAGPQSIELGTHGEPNERVTVIEVLEDRVVGLEAGLDPREDILNAHTGTVANITGLDGKTYKRTAASPRKRAPLPDAIEACVRDIQGRVERLARLADDDRLPQNRDKVAARNHSDLVRIIDALQRVTTTIGQPAN